jgi:hypothetical protein
MRCCGTIDEGNGNLRVVPAGGASWQLEIYEGRTEPTIQGWYSAEYNLKEPCPTAVYTARVDTQATFAWVMIPGRGPPPKGAVRALAAPAGAGRVRICLPGKTPIEVAVRLAGKAEVGLPGGLALDGQCAVLREGAAPLVVGGRITDAGGTTVAAHSYEDTPRE